MEIKIKIFGNLKQKQNNGKNMNQNNKKNFYYQLMVNKKIYNFLLNNPYKMYINVYFKQRIN